MASQVVQPSDVIVTYEDQSRINEFASLNAKLEECKEELSSKEKDLSNIEDALREIDNLSITDEESVYILEGGIFIKFSIEDAIEHLTSRKENQIEEINTLKDEIERIKEKMSSLKVALYARFGRNNINLEADE